jgi:PAS domain S-box-containing protein
LSSEAKRPTEPVDAALRLTPAAANQAFAVYAVLLLIGGWIYAGLSIRSDYERTLESARDQLRVVAAGLEAQVGAMLNDGIGAAFAAANELDASGGLTAATDTQASATLGRMLTGGDYVRSLFIGSTARFARAGRDGKVGDRRRPAWFTALIEPEPAGNGAIGALIDDPDRPPHHVIPIARRLTALGLPDVWAGGLFDFHELNERYRRSIGESNALLLLLPDGTILVRVPNPRGVDVTKIKDSDMVRRALQSPNAGVVEGVAPLLNSEAIAAYQRLTDYPLYVAAGVTRETALAGWETRRRDTLVFTAVASVVLIIMTWMLNHYVGALRGRELHYRTLFNNAGFSALMLDGDRFIDANRTTRSMFAVPKDETMLGMRPWEVSPERQPDGTLSRDLAQQRIATALETGQAKFEWTHKRMDSGEPFPAEVELATLRADDRTLTLAVVHDLTERKRAEQSWRESEARYRSLIEALPEAVFVHRGREPLFGNQAAAALVGAPSVEALAEYSVLSFVEDADRDIIRERSRLILEEGVSAAPRVVRIRRLDGSMMWAEAEGVPVTFDGKPAVQTIVRDITARKLQEEARMAAAERSRRQSEALLRLAARADAHVDDFRAALTRICQVAADVLAANRAEVWVLDGPQARCHASYADGVTPTASARTLDSRLLSSLAAALRSQRVLGVRDVGADTLGLRLPQSGILEPGATSAIVAAIHIAGELEAFAVVTDRRERREWHGDELAFFGGIADQIAQTRLDSERERAFDELGELAGQLVRAQDEARRSIGRDLHDSTGQTLAALEVNLARLGRASTGLPPEQRRILEECIDLAGQCSAEIRTASYLLHPPLLDELGLASALRWLVDGFRDRSGIEVALDLPLSLPRLDRDSELALFRVAQEALTNVHRHSGSPSARLAVKCGPGGIVLEIEDSGRGLPQSSARARDSAPALSVGLAGMRERMRQIGGNVVVESGVTGTRVRASLPQAAAMEMSGSA